MGLGSPPFRLVVMERLITDIRWTSLFHMYRYSLADISFSRQISAKPNVSNTLQILVAFHKLQISAKESDTSRQYAYGIRYIVVSVASKPALNTEHTFHAECSAVDRNAGGLQASHSANV